MENNNQNIETGKKKSWEERQQEKQKLREERKRKKLFKKIFVWVASVILISLAVYGMIFYINQSEKNNPGKAFSILGGEHIRVGASHPSYNSNPPTSGWHYGRPVNWGVYESELEDEQVLHNLEHGGIWISYKPDIDESIKLKLEKIGKSNPGGVVVSPRSANDSNVAVASWGRLLKLDNFNENKIKLFIRLNKNRSPEQFAR